MVTPVIHAHGLGEAVMYAVRKLPRQQAIIFMELYFAGSKGLSGKELTYRLYRDTPECGPLWAEEAVRVVKHRLQRKLPELGFTIVSRPGRHGFYRLERIQPCATTNTPA